MKANTNFTKLPQSYLFSEVAARIRYHKESNPESEVIRMDIGDVTLPIARCVLDAMHKGIEEMASTATFRGYGPEQGYAFLREAISEGDYKSRGLDISPDEIFISDGAKSDLGNLGDIYSSDSVVAVADPGYPVYVDTAVMGGRGGDLTESGRWNKIVYIDCTPENGFVPRPPKEHADVVYLCSPNNPTGVVFDRETLKEWVDYARREKAVIVYDSAYEAFVDDPAVPRSIYEIPGAQEVAIEIRSFSKTAGFTGLRCGYTVVPKALKASGENGEEVSVNRLWNRRQSTKFNGASYPIQCGAAALYSPEGRAAIKENIDVYKSNARYIKKKLSEAGFETYGGEHSPYVWARHPEQTDSWALFAKLLKEAGISCTPGIGFGRAGGGYIRLTGFNTPEKTREAMDRLGKVDF